MRLLSYSALMLSVWTGMLPLGAASRAELHRVFCPYWTTLDGYSSVVQLHNNLIADSIVVQPVLLSAHGVRSELDRINLGPLENVSLDIGSALLKTSIAGARRGSVVFEYSYKNGAALLAEVSVTEPSSSISYTIPGSELGASVKDQHAVFWLPSSQSEAYITLQNASTQPVHVSASFEGLGSGPQPFETVTLGPGASRLVEVPVGSAPQSQTEGAERFGAVVLRHDAPDGTLHTSGWIEEEGTGYSNMFTFYDPGRHSGTSLYGPQVFVGQRHDLLASGRQLTIDSNLVLLNTGEAPVVPQGEFYFESGGQMTHIPLPLTTLAPGQSSLVKLTALQKDGSIPDGVTMGSVVIHYAGAPATLMGRVYGIADDPTFGFYTALETDTPSKINEAYWTTAGDANSFLTVTNFGSQPDDVNIVFTFAKNTWSMPKITLAPFQSTTVNVRDWKGKGLPAEADFGGFRVFGNSAVNSKLVAKEHVVSERSRVSMPFYNDPPPYVTGFGVKDLSDNYLYSLAMSPGDAPQVGAYLFWSDGSEALVATDVSSGDQSVAVASERGTDPMWTTVTAENQGDTQITWQSPAVPSDYQRDLQTWTVQVSADVQPAELIISSSNLGVGDCYWPNGAQLTIGYTRVLSWQVVGPAPNHTIFRGTDVPTVQESVVTTGGPNIVGGGVWMRSNNSISPTGVFADFLSANGNAPSTANQTFSATRPNVGTKPLIENIGGMRYGTLGNYYSTSTIMINGTTAPRACQTGDPN